MKKHQNILLALLVVVCMCITAPVVQAQKSKDFAGLARFAEKNAVSVPPAYIFAACKKRCRHPCTGRGTLIWAFSVGDVPGGHPGGVITPESSDRNVPAGGNWVPANPRDSRQ